jgi:hypothetical protein
MNIKHLILAGFIVLVSPLSNFAQTGKIKNVELIMSGSDPNIEDAKYNIDLAASNEATSNMAGMWGWRGIIYTVISSSADPAIIALVPNKDAALIAGQSFQKFYSFPEADQKKYSALDYANGYVVSAIISCFNEGVSYASDSGSFDKVKAYMSIVDDLLKYDKEQALFGKISKEKALYISWQSAYTNKLVNEEIELLQKLIDIPSYMNSYVFIRMSEIYLEQKNYDKAVSFLEAGKIKIPSKSGEFLNQQINIEIERNNIQSLLVKFTEGIQNEPDNKDYYFSRGVSYHQLKMEDRNNQEKAIKNDEKPAKDKYYFSQGLADYAKAIQLDPSYTDALNNEAILLLDSADYIYKQRTRVESSQYTKYDKLSVALYGQVVQKLVALYEMNFKKDQELVDLLKTIKSIYAKLNDEEKRSAYDKLYKQEKSKLE